MVTVGKRQLGEILLESGRITQPEVQRGLEYQRVHGGFFGQAIVALGILTRDEVDYFLSHQLDLPYIFPNAAAIDRDAARLVSPDWALSNLAVPIIRAGDELTVVAPEPLSDAAIREAREMTGCEIQLALASAQRIRELIHVIYGDPAVVEAARPPISFQEFLGEALDAGADRFGVSVRGGEATGWFKSDHVERYHLGEGWSVLLNDALEPKPSEKVDLQRTGLSRWEGSITRADTPIEVHVQTLVGTGGVEYLFEPVVAPTARTSVRHVVMPTSISTELRLLARSGRSWIGVSGSNLDFVHELLPHLPRMVFEYSVRSVHVTDQKTLPAGVYSIAANGDPLLPDTIASYDFDAITVDVRGGRSDVEALMRTAPLSFVLLSRGIVEHSIDWRLRIERSAAGSLAWDLAPIPN